MLNKTCNHISSGAGVADVPLRSNQRSARLGIGHIPGGQDIAFLFPVETENVNGKPRGSALTQGVCG